MNCLSKTLSALFLALFALPACAAQKDGDYQGDALASIHGNVIVEGGAQTSVRVVVAWSSISANYDQSEVQDVTVSASFPERFRLDVVAPPGREVFTDFSLGGYFLGNSPIAVGNIVAIRADANVYTVTRDDIAGWVKDQVLLYVGRDVAPNTATASFLGGPLAQGFHLMNVKRLTSAERDAKEAARNQCYRDNAALSDDQVWDLCGVPRQRVLIEVHEAPAGFDTPVTLKLAPVDRLDLPSGL